MTQKILNEIQSRYSYKDIKRELLRRELESDLLVFTKWYFREIYKIDFDENWHHRVICDYLMKIHSGEIQNLIINIAPRYTKTELAVKAFIAWSLAKKDTCKFIHLSYSDDLALDNSSQIKEIITHEAFQDIWNMNLKGDAKSKKKWYTESGGGLYSTSTGGQITGFGAGEIGDEYAGAIILDDPLKPDDARSDTIREAINNRFNTTIKSRRNNPNKTPIIVVMQRLHEDDFTGFLLNGGSELEWTHLNLPTLNENGPSEYDHREIGEPLWAKKHDVEILKAMASKDSLNFAGQYQQRPSPAEGNLLKRENIRFYRELPDNLTMQIHSWDMTFKNSKTSDFVVGTSWASNFKDHYLVDCLRKKMSFTETLDAIKLFIRKNSKYNAILIEDKANGTAIMDVIKKEFNRVIPINPKESKEARFASVTPLFESGNVYLPHPDICPWVSDFIDEMLVFPNGKHDDQVDSTSQALNYLNKKTNNSLYKLAGM